MRLKFILILGLALAGCDAGHPETGNGSVADPVAPGQSGAGRLDRSQAGTAAPDVTFQDPDGDPASLADFRGKPLLLNLWATWCAPCVAEMPTLNALAAREPGLQVVAVSQDLQGREKVDSFFAERDLRMLEPYLDSEMSLMTTAEVDTLPTTILYDADGKEVWRMTGMEDWQGKRAAALIAEAAGG